MTIIEKHKELCDRIHETCVAKNHDYGNSVNKLYDEFGLISYIVRINDKVNRINALVKTNDRQVKDEKITDTLLDLANYALLTVANIELEEETKSITKEDKEIKKINIIYDGETNHYFLRTNENLKCWITEAEEELINKTNELIDKVNSLEKK